MSKQTLEAEPVVKHAASLSSTASKGVGRRTFSALGFLSPTLILLAVLMALPIGMVIWYSLQNNVITNPDPEFVGLRHYRAILTDPTFHAALKNTAVFVFASVAAHLVIGLTFAMLLNTRLLPPWVKAVFRAIFVLPWLMTVAIVAVLWRLIMNPNGVLNYVLDTTGIISEPQEWLSDPRLALFSVVLISIWNGYPFFMISLLAGLQGIPDELYEAASVDGAGPIRRFSSITIPQLQPIIISMGLLDLIWTSHQFALIWMTTGGGPLDRTEMLSTYTYKNAFMQYQFSTASASAVVVLVLTALLAVAYVRHQRARD
ncbi:carbohydrate ABC transporter permease [Bogoriella caseilytica]|uniref:Carbohydrate ABC transporter membrane protein 1 (CUT1 family) n=1 Tax=Bogoriella caseilytica TaxID=56055 RepID=A0A3N2BD31_9MICO|nr:sugar ABC transporter permease [Bogoriella caseilytica]ROR73148.1 carbohydrate ABC transporter membrane protein 1 (CUT1 family) [Bogoriella caseilytica]